MVYYESDVGRVEWDDDLGAAVLRWTEFTTGEKFREGCLKQIDCLEDHGAHKMLTDTSSQETINEEDQAWTLEEWAPKADKAGLEYLAIVYPESIVGEMAVDQVLEQINDEEDTITRNIFDDVEEAREWLAEAENLQSPTT
jgi:hypothetical protein